MRGISLPSAVVLFLASAGAAFAGPIHAEMIGGELAVLGRAVDAQGNEQIAELPGTVGPMTASASGGTSSGLVNGSVAMSAFINPGAVATTMTLSGIAAASQPASVQNPYDGFASIAANARNWQTRDRTPLILEIEEELIFNIVNTGDTAVTFTAATGQIMGDHLMAGTYEVWFSLVVRLDDPEVHQVVSTLDWTLTLTRVPAPSAIAVLGLGLTAARRRR